MPVWIYIIRMHIRDASSDLLPAYHKIECHQAAIHIASERMPRFRSVTISLPAQDPKQ